jgi:hypothetical protein
MTRSISIDRLLRVLAIKGLAKPQALADALLTTPDDLQPVLEGLVRGWLGVVRRRRLPPHRYGYRQSRHGARRTSETDGGVTAPPPRSTASSSSTDG